MRTMFELEEFSDRTGNGGRHTAVCSNVATAVDYDGRIVPPGTNCLVSLR